MQQVVYISKSKLNYIIGSLFSVYLSTVIFDSWSDWWCALQSSVGFPDCCFRHSLRPVVPSAAEDAYHPEQVAFEKVRSFVCH